MSLHVAAAAGDVDAVCRFALAAADINFPNQQGLTAVFVGAREGHVNVLKQLHALRADMSRPNLNGATPLFVASRMGHLSAVQFLVSVGASVSQPSNDGWTPLHIASESGHLAVVKYLITQGASVTEPNHDGFSPLQIATNKGHLHVAAVLVAFGADPFVKNRNNFSAVDTAVKTHQSIVLDFFNGLKAGSSSALGLIGNAFLVLSADEEEISTNNLADVQRLLDAQIQKGENLELQLAFELGTKRAIEDDLAEEKYKTLALEATCHQLQTEVDEARATCQQLRAELDQALAARLQAERSKVFDLVKQGRELDIAAVSELAGYWKLALPADAFSGQVTVRSILEASNARMLAGKLHCSYGDALALQIFLRRAGERRSVAQPRARETTHLRAILHQAGCPELLSSFQLFDVDDDLIYLVDIHILGNVDFDIGEHEDVLKRVIAEHAAATLAKASAQVSSVSLLIREDD
eukprot:m.142345 g.142345  ORF g.142345 m.142345 type:complete len:467 (+) comp52616_c0_seq5:80-1480(+)